MRICYLINGLNGGGAGLPVPNIVALMQRAGHEVYIVALAKQDGRCEESLQRAGIAYRIIGPDHLSAPAFVRLLRILRRERPDAIWTSLTRASIFGQLCGRWLGIPVVSWQHNAYLRSGNRFLLRLLRSIPRLWVVDSYAVRDFTMRELGIPGERIHIWPLFKTSAVPIAEGWRTGSAGPYRIGSLGRLHPNKGYDVLIRALAHLAEHAPECAGRLEVHVAGDGPERARLRALAHELRIDNFHLAGFIDGAAQFLSTLHAYVQPSRREGLCLAAHEALEAALPVIATPVGQLAYSIVDGETGFRCEVEDVESLSAALRRVVDAPEAAAGVGKTARRKILDAYSSARFEAAGREILDRLEASLVAG